ncbi:MAG TPA: RNA-binding domain-containing protein [Chitinispirillaceae bacterium]|nr:RNA-binding domain-containing protein [Chitinispirillaceae bacterium]
MRQNEIRKIIISGENISVEFKTASKSLPASLYESICAMLNRNGGTILLGVTDSGEITGINKPLAQEFCKDIANTSNNPQKITPAFLLHPEVITIDEKEIISVYVPASSQVHRLNGKVYDRSVDGDYEVKNDNQIHSLYLRKGAIYTENTIFPYLSEADFYPGIVDKVRSLIEARMPDHPWNVLKKEQFFRISGLFRKDLSKGVEGFTQAALLLLGKEESILSALPHYKTDLLLRRDDIDRYDDRVNIRCNLIDAYEIMMAFISKHLPDKFHLEHDYRIALREKIFREIVANFIIHREYANAYPATLVIYKDCVEVKNANKPFYHGPISPEMITPFPKNPVIAKFFTQMGRSEELGTGFQNVFKYIKAYSGSDTITLIDMDEFSVSIPVSTDDKVTNRVTSQLSENQQKILQILEENTKISIAQIAEVIGISSRNVKENIAKLKEVGYVERMGTTRDGVWIVKKKN